MDDADRQPLTYASRGFAVRHRRLMLIALVVFAYIGTYGGFRIAHVIVRYGSIPQEVDLSPALSNAWTRPLIAWRPLMRVETAVWRLLTGPGKRAAG
jgi:hypothetical protein